MSALLQQLLPASLTHEGKMSYLYSSFIMVTVTWLSWRIWAFTLKPFLEPREPRLLPYWIPVIGHAFSFFKDTEGTFTRARTYFGDAREPFGLMVAGQRLYIVTSPQDVADIYKNTKSLTFDEYVQDVMKSIGVSDDGIIKLWHEYGNETTSTELHKALAHAGEDYYREQLLPGHRLDIPWERILRLIDQSVQWDQLPQSSNLAADDGGRNIRLLEWSREVLLKSVTTAFFGPQLLDIEPQLLQYYVEFDEESWKLTYKYPRRVSRKMYRAKDMMVAAVEAFLRLPKEQRPDGAWLISKLESETSKIGISVSDLAARMTSLVWVILGNAYKLCFWMMAYMLFDPTLYASIKAEITPAVTAGVHGLESRLGECPKMMALYNEILRLTTASASVRTVESDTPLGGVILRKGGKVLLPFRQLHFNEKVFGSNVDQFDPARFLGDGNLQKISSFRPFGGGTTYCPGHYVAQREVLVFIALTMFRFKSISLAEQAQQAFPELDTKKPCLGIMTPVAGQDVQITMQKNEAHKAPGTKAVV